ncbi:MAG: hypothetical protein DRJ49_04690 [Thermoprotei archaeon]|nr:MAG: hypothetical protein DRJ49_04690 [Thermoprotei archaeon]
MDGMVGEIVDALADEDTLVVVVSDHGIIGYRGEMSDTELVRKILIENGYLVYRERPEIGFATKPQVEREITDWSKTKAIVHDDIYIYINLRG